MALSIGKLVVHHAKTDPTLKGHLKRETIIVVYIQLFHL